MRATIEYIVALVGVVTVVGTIGCASAPTIGPADDAQLADGGPGATATAHGVRLVATVDRWRWNPGELDEFVTPMLIDIENKGDRPVRVRLSDIRLMGDRGVDLAALPPYRIKGRVERTVQTHAYAVEGFYAAPHLRHHYSRYPIYDDPFFYNRHYYRTYHPVYRTYAIELPTQAMLDRALPEGVLEPGGKVTGFTYFERVDGKVAKRTKALLLVMKVADAESGEELGTVEIPFAVQP
jgi:hypothetical protein